MSIYLAVSQVFTNALWAKIVKNPDVSTGPLVHLLVCSHRSLVRLLRTAHFARALCSLIRSLAHFAPSLARGKVND